MRSVISTRRRPTARSRAHLAASVVLARADRQRRCCPMVSICGDGPTLARGHARTIAGRDRRAIPGASARPRSTACAACGHTRRFASLEVGTAFGVVRYSHDLAIEPAACAAGARPAHRVARRDRRPVRATPSTAVVLDRAAAFARIVPCSKRQAARSATSTLLDGDRLRQVCRARGARPLRRTGRALGIALPAELCDRAGDDAARRVPCDHVARQCRRATRDRDRSDRARDLRGGRRGRRSVRSRRARVELASRRCVSRRRDRRSSHRVRSSRAARYARRCRRDHDSKASLHGARATPPTSCTPQRMSSSRRDRDRVRVFDDGDGHLLGELASSHVAAVDVAAMALVDQPSRAIGSSARAAARVDMWPAWSISIRGRVRALAAAGDGVLVALEDGDAYRIDRTHREDNRDRRVPARAGTSAAIWSSARPIGGPRSSESAAGPAAPVLEIYKPVDLEAAPAIGDAVAEATAR